MKRSQSMIFTEEHPDVKSLNLSGKNQIDFPMNFHEMYPCIESLDLSNNQLDDSSFNALLHFITMSGTLRFLNIAHNPLASNCVLCLHEYADQKIELVSDLSHWSEAHPEQEFPKINWALSPGQWGRESHCREIFEAIAFSWVDKPQTRPEFIAAITPILHQKNQLGWTPLICATRLSSPKLACALMDRLGAEVFTELLISSCQDPSMMYLLIETWLPGMVHHCYLTHARRPDLALRLVQTLLPEICGARCEMMGNITAFEKNYVEAHQYYRIGASYGWTPCNYSLAIMMINQYAPDILPFNESEITRHLQLAADAGNVCAMLDLGLALEKGDDINMAYLYYSKAEMHIEATPNILHGMSLAHTHLYAQRMRFVRDVSDMINGVLFARVEQTAQRALQLAPAYHHFNKEALHVKHSLTFGQPCLNKIMTAVGNSLLKHYVNNEKCLTEIGVNLCDKVRRSATPNQELLSMDPETFAQSFVNSIEHQLAQRFGSMMRSGLVGKI